MTFTALSIIQPWPWLILRPDVADPVARAELRDPRAAAEKRDARPRIKDCENREWETPVRGWVLLHASSSRLSKWSYQEVGLFAAKRGVPEIPLRDNLPYRAVVGAIRIDDCTWTHRSPWFVGPRAFVLGAAVPFAWPVQCPGALRFFKLPPDGSAAGGLELWQELAAQIRGAGLAKAFDLEPNVALSRTALVDSQEFKLT